MSDMKFLKLDKKGVVISIKITPNSSDSFVIGYNDEYLKLKISAPPLENKANKELVNYLAKILRVPKSSFSLIAGDKSKIKRLLIKGVDVGYIAEKFSVYDKINE